MRWSRPETQTVVRVCSRRISKSNLNHKKAICGTGYIFRGGGPIVAFKSGIEKIVCIIYNRSGINISYIYPKV